MAEVVEAGVLERGAPVTPAYSEHAGFVDVVGRHGGALARLARRLVGSAADAEEIVQEALLRAYTDRMRRARQPREEVAAVYKITRNLSIDLLRRRRPRLVDSCVVDTYPARVAPTPEEELELDALREAVRLAVADLPAKYREVVAMRFGMGMSYRTIARALHIGLSCMESRLFRAKKRLRKALAPWVGPSRRMSRGGA